MSRITERALFDMETGEVIAELREGDRIVRKESIEYWKEFKTKKQRSFTKVDASEGMFLLKELNANERSLLFILQFYVSYDSGLIRHVNGRDILFGDVVEMSGWSRATTMKAIDGLVEKNIIYKGKNGKNVQYYMNPWIATKGVKINPTLKEMFKHYKIRSKGNITWEQLDRQNDKG